MVAPDKPRVVGRPFKKGQSGNPSGRPVGARSKRMLALDALAEGEADAVVAAMLEKAKQGDVTAAGLILSRVWGPRKGRPTPIALPAVRTAEGTTAALAAVVAAVSSGELTPDEAQAVAGVLEVQRKAIETQELERRIAALESAKEGGG